MDIFNKESNALLTKLSSLDNTTEALLDLFRMERNNQLSEILSHYCTETEHLGIIQKIEVIEKHSLSRNYILQADRDTCFTLLEGQQAILHTYKKVADNNEQDKNARLEKVDEFEVNHARSGKLFKENTFYFLETKNPVIRYSLQKKEYLPVRQVYQMNGNFSHFTASNMLDSRIHYLCKLMLYAEIENRTEVLNRLLHHDVEFVRNEARKCLELVSDVPV